MSDELQSPKTVDHVPPAPEALGQGPAEPSRPSFVLGDRVGPYQLVRYIHRGAFGQVWVGRHQFLDEHHAVKVLFDDQRGAIELNGIRRYKSIADRHPGLVPIQELGCVPGRGYYYAMPLADDVRGRATLREVTSYEPMTLRRYREMHRPLPIDRVLTVALHLLPSLNALHDAGLIHRDIKPDNIIRVEGMWKCCDPGLTTRRDESRGDCGTPGYVPPEGTLDRRADLYALGVTLFELATEYSLGQLASYTNETLPLPGDDVRQKSLRSIIQTACNRDLNARYQTAREMSEAVNALIRTTKVTVVLDDNFSAFTQSRMDDFLRAVRETGFHVFGSPVCESGSVRITLELAEDEVERFRKVIGSESFVRFRPLRVERLEDCLAGLVTVARFLQEAKEIGRSTQQTSIVLPPEIESGSGLPASRHIWQPDRVWPLLSEMRRVEVNAAQQAILNRYRPAIYRYLRACLDEEGADEVLQEFSLRFVRGDFRNANPERGRFRDLLKSALYHLIIDHHKKRNRAMAQLAPEAPEPAAAADSTLDSDRQFLAEWRTALLAKAWEALAEEERKTGQFLHTVLLLRASHPEMRSAQMAVELTTKLNRQVSADWVRKWLLAAREKFAEFLLAEVAGSLEDRGPASLEQELIDLELYQYCKIALDGYREDSER